MRRMLMIAGAWLGATSMAITLSWFGVSTVLRSTVQDPPRAVTLPDEPSPERTPPHPSGPEPEAPETDGPSGEPEDAASTDGPSPAETDSPGPNDAVPPVRGEPHSPGGEPPPGGGSHPPPPAESGGPPPLAESEPPPADGGTGPADPGLGSVETVRTQGGRVALELHDRSADLVSASPASGWEMQVWDEPTWIRVTFTHPEAGRSISVFCVFNGHPPTITQYEDQPA